MEKREKRLVNLNKPPEKVELSREDYFKLREDEVFVGAQNRLFVWAAGILTVLSILGWCGAQYIVKNAVDNAVEDTKKKVNVESIEKEVKAKLLEDVNVKKAEVIAMMEQEAEKIKKEMEQKRKELKGEVAGEVKTQLPFWLGELGPEKLGPIIYPLFEGDIYKLKAAIPKKEKEN